MSHYCFFFNDTATTEIYTYCHTLSLHDALPIWCSLPRRQRAGSAGNASTSPAASEQPTRLGQGHRPPGPAGLDDLDRTTIRRSRGCGLSDVEQQEDGQMNTLTVSAAGGDATG